MSITLPGHTRTRLHRIKHVGKLVQIQISRTQLANSRIALKSQLVPQDTAGHYALCLKSNASLEIKMQVALEKLQRYVQVDAINRTYVAPGTARLNYHGQRLRQVVEDCTDAAIGSDFAVHRQPHG